MPEESAQSKLESKKTMWKGIAWAFGIILCFMVLDRSLNWGFIESIWPLAIVIIGILSSWGTYSYLKKKQKDIDEILKQISLKLESKGFKFVSPHEFEYEELDEDEIAAYHPVVAKTVVWSIRKQNIIRLKTMTLHQYNEEYSASKLEAIRRKDAREQRDQEEEGAS